MPQKIPPEAFNYYVALGPDRSYRAVAEHFGVSKRGVTKRAAAENWAERLEKIEAEAREKSDKRLAETVEEMRTRHLKTLRAMSSRALSALKQYPLTSGMDAMRSAELVIKLERLVVGEPSERTAMSVEETTRREIHNLLIVEEDDEDEAQAG